MLNLTVVNVFILNIYLTNVTSVLHFSIFVLYSSNIVESGGVSCDAASQLTPPLSTILLL